jgi:DNA-binding NtrC family response regulator
MLLSRHSESQGIQGPPDAAPAAERGIITMIDRNNPRSTVLVVDDEGLIRWSLAEMLEASGYTVFEAGDARHALEYFQHRTPGDSPCVVLLDLRLPDSTDLGLLRRIREMAPACRVILMTAYGTPEVVDEAMRLGAFRVVGKPFDLQAMMGVVRAASC